MSFALTGGLDAQGRVTIYRDTWGVPHIYADREADGFYGLGYGDLLYGLCLAENTILNQHIDGVTLKNAKPMFMSRSLRMKRGEINVQPGSAIEVDALLGAPA